MRILRLAVAAALATSLMGSTSYAVDADGAIVGDDAQCSCVTGAAPDGSVGQFLSTNGEVLTSGSNDYEKAHQGTPILVGSEIIVPANGSAVIAVGDACGSVNLDGGTVTRISRLGGGNICVAPAGGTPAAAAPGLPIGPILIAGGAGLGLALLLALNGDDDDPVSP